MDAREGVLRPSQEQQESFDILTEMNFLLSPVNISRDIPEWGKHSCGMWTVFWERKGEERWSKTEDGSNVKAAEESVTCLYNSSFNQSFVLNLNFSFFQPLLPFSPIPPLL